MQSIDRIVLETIMERNDLYGERSGELAVAMNQTSDRNRTLQVFSLVEDELGAMGCVEAVSTAKRGGWGGGPAFARACPASPLTPEDASRVSADDLAVATALEARAAKAGKSDDPVHQALVKALLHR